MSELRARKLPSVINSCWAAHSSIVMTFTSGFRVRLIGAHLTQSGTTVLSTKQRDAINC